MLHAARNASVGDIRRPPGRVEPGERSDGQRRADAAGQRLR
jgi:hypothetical protein